MSDDLKDIIKDRESMGYLEIELFHLLNEFPHNNDRFKLLRRFVLFLSWYQKQIDNGQAHENIMVGGRYEAIEQVKYIDWNRMEEIILRLEERANGADKPDISDIESLSEEEEEELIGNY